MLTRHTAGRLSSGGTSLVPSACRPGRQQSLRRVQQHPFKAQEAQCASPAERLACSSSSSDTAAAPSGASSGPGTRGFEYTAHEGNSWAASFKASGVNVLVDPWLVGNLVFANADWLYKGVKRVFKPGQEAADAIAANTDFLLLTMSLPDHCHEPTLRALPKSLPVVASPSAAAVARGLGFSNVIELAHGQSATLCDGKMTVAATEGALVGPPWSTRENGFVLRETVPGGVSLYYEPHCDYTEESVASVGQVDVAISPPTSQVLAGVYPLVKGSTDNLQLMKLLRPKVLVPLYNAEFDSSGPLNAIIVERGDAQQLQAELQSAGLPTRVVMPATAGTPLTVEV